MSTPAPSRRSFLRPMLALVAIAGFAGAGWLALKEATTPRDFSPPLAELPLPAPEPPEPRLVLDRASSDEAIRKAAQPLSGGALWARWLGESDLARRIAAAIGAIAEGQSPRGPLSMLAPEAPFEVRETPGYAFVAPSTFARSNAVVALIASLDPKASARVWRTIHPFVEAAWAEIGAPGSRVETVLGEAVTRLLRVPVPEGPLMVKPRGAVWVFADPALEALSPAEKHLLRLGPTHQKTLQKSLKALADALELPLM